NGLIVISFDEVVSRTGFVTCWRFWVESDGLSLVSDSFVVFTLEKVHIGSMVVGLMIFRVKANYFCVVQNSLIVFTPVAMAPAPKRPGWRILRDAAKCLTHTQHE